MERARSARRYVEICLVTLTNPAATLSPDLKAAKDEYEWRTDLGVLKALREVTALTRARAFTSSFDLVSSFSSYLNIT